MRAWLLEAAVVAIAAVLVSYLLFGPPMVGLADQGDFSRIMTGFGLGYPPEVTQRQRYFCYFENRFLLEKPTTPPFASTESLLVMTAVGANRLLGRTSVFDIRMLGTVHLIAFLGAVYLLLRQSRGLRFRSRLLLAVLVLFIGCDIGYTALFDSMYLEPATYIVGIAFIAVAVALTRQPSTARLLWAVAALLLFLAAKSQNVPMGLVAAGFLPVALRPRWNVAWIASGMAVAALLIASSVVVSDNTRHINLYNDIFLQVLPFSPTPAADLRELGLDPGLAALAGKSAFAPGAPVFDASRFPREASYARLLRFYAVHPSRFWHLTARGVLASLSNRTNYLGNYLPADSPKCLTFTHSFGLWDAMRRRLRAPWLFVPLMAALGAIPLATSLRVADPRIRRLLWLQVCFASMAGVGFYTAILGDGNEFQKHLFPFNFCIDACLIATALWISEFAGSAGPKPANRPRSTP